MVKRSQLYLCLYASCLAVFYMLFYSNYFKGIADVFLMLAVIFGLLIFLRKLQLRNSKKLFIILIIIAIYLSFVHLKVNNSTRFIVAIFTSCIGIGSFESERKFLSSLYIIKLMTFLLVLIFGGFEHVNTIAVNGISLLMLQIYFNDMHQKKELRFFLYSILFYVALILYTRSSTAMICGLIIITLYITRNKKITRSFLYSWFVRNIFLIIFFVNLLLITLWNNYICSFYSFGNLSVVFPNDWTKGIIKFLRFVDIVSSYRLSLAGYSFRKFGINLFGEIISLTSPKINVNYFTVDSGMTLLIQEWGVFISAIVLIILSKVMRYLQKCNKDILIIMGIVIAIYAISEDVLLIATFNILFFFAKDAFMMKTYKQNSIAYKSRQSFEK